MMEGRFATSGARCGMDDGLAAPLPDMEGALKPPGAPNPARLAGAGDGDREVIFDWSRDKEEEGRCQRAPLWSRGRRASPPLRTLLEVVEVLEARRALGEALGLAAAFLGAAAAFFGAGAAFFAAAAALGAVVLAAGDAFLP